MFSKETGANSGELRKLLPELEPYCKFYICKGILKILSETRIIREYSLNIRDLSKNKFVKIESGAYFYLVNFVPYVLLYKTFCTFFGVIKSITKAVHLYVDGDC